MSNVLQKLREFFYSGPVKSVPDGHNHCPACEGTGEFDTMIDCLYCNGDGYVAHSELVKILSELNDK